jgi:hypothetical protein
VPTEMGYNSEDPVKDNIVLKRLRPAQSTIDFRQDFPRAALRRGDRDNVGLLNKIPYLRVTNGTRASRPRP